MVVSEKGEAMTGSDEILKHLVDGTAALAPLGGIGEKCVDLKAMVMQR